MFSNEDFVYIIDKKHNFVTCKELESIWCKLSPEKQEKLKYHLPCYKHYNVGGGGDEIDGPPISITKCSVCVEKCDICTY